MESASLEIPVKGHFFFLKNVLNSYFQNKMVGYAKPFRSKGFTSNTIPASFHWGSTCRLPRGQYSVIRKVCPGSMQAPTNLKSNTQK